MEKYQMVTRLSNAAMKSWFYHKQSLHGLKRHIGEEIYLYVTLTHPLPYRTSRKLLLRLSKRPKIKDMLKCFAGLGSNYAFVSLQAKLIKDYDFLLSFANEVRAYLNAGQLCLTKKLLFLGKVHDVKKIQCILCPISFRGKVFSCTKV